MNKIVEEFIAFAKRQYGVTLTATPSKDGEHFRDFYGYDFNETLTNSGLPENQSDSCDLPSAKSNKFVQNNEGDMTMTLKDTDEIMHRLKGLNDHSNGDEHFLNGIETAMEVIESAPAVKAITFAHWEKEPNLGSYWHCSNCLHVEGIACIAMDYCPHCGAQMAEHPWLASGCGQTFNPD